ncbi:FAD/NAD(P)-binding protein [Agrobacterium vitis]|uniref:FAD/NAD(P)-binding protein n=1 Tax=Agrobacterium vitis TaxID=373 RepID=UPI0012E97F08|nr:FAD/NAD(P)-binding protein [Agrobacterium vitis]
MPAATPPQAQKPPTIAIIGGGFTGAAVAWNLARKTQPGRVRIVIYEPRARLGGGLAYDTSDPAHRINVPADRMSLDPDAPLDFLDWIGKHQRDEEDKEAALDDGRIFPRRRDFGVYIASKLAPYLADNRIDHIKSDVVALDQTTRGWRVTQADGATLEADDVVIATSHPSPRPPKALAAILEGHPRFIPDATVPDALNAIRPDDAVLIVGNGLTGADIAASLLARKHQGPITSISRRGLRSRGHAGTIQEPYGDFIDPASRSIRHLTRRIREQINHAAAEGISWHAVLDAVRAQAQEIWGGLPLDERRRLVRHLRPFWDVHRFRIAPQVEGAINQAISRGQMEILAASVHMASYDGPKIRISLRLARSTEKVSRVVDAVVIATGPAHGAIIDNQPYLRNLALKGLIGLDPTGLGLHCDRQSRLLDQRGAVTPGLLVAGPLARGTFGELMGLPQVAHHARDTADHLHARLEDARHDATATAEDAA